MEFPQSPTGIFQSSQEDMDKVTSYALSVVDFGEFRCRLCHKCVSGHDGHLRSKMHRQRVAEEAALNYMLGEAKTIRRLGAQGHLGQTFSRAMLDWGEHLENLPGFFLYLMKQPDAAIKFKRSNKGAVTIPGWQVRGASLAVISFKATEGKKYQNHSNGLESWWELPDNVDGQDEEIEHGDSAGYWPVVQITIDEQYLPHGKVKVIVCVYQLLERCPTAWPYS